MCVNGVRPRVKSEEVSEVESAKYNAVSAIAEQQPEDVRDVSLEAGDGASFVSEPEKQDLRKRALT